VLVKEILKRALLKIMALEIFPIKKNKIIFDNFNGKGFGCNPKYIALELIKSRKKNRSCMGS
jgi:CDP-glycerol glycerophosphotransferase